MIKAILLTSAAICLTSSALSQTYTAVDKDAAIQLAVGWKSDATSIAPPLVHISESSDGNAALTILKEKPTDVNTLGDYTSSKIELLGSSYPDFNPTAPKMGEVNGLRAAFFDSTATVKDPNGNQVQAKFALMTVEGKDHFYILIGLIQEDASPEARNKLVQMYTSFKENE